MVNSENGLMIFIDASISHRKNKRNKIFHYSPQNQTLEQVTWEIAQGEMLITRYDESKHSSLFELAQFTHDSPVSDSGDYKKRRWREKEGAIHARIFSKCFWRWKEEELEREEGVSE